AQHDLHSFPTRRSSDLWTQYQAEVLRSIPVSDNRFDREHIVAEIEDLGKSERDAVRSRIRPAIEHPLKLAHSPADPSRLDWIARSEEHTSELQSPDHLV